MPAEKNPVFRKAVIPWYKSTSVYIIMIIVMLVVFFFALTGIAVAREIPEYQGYIRVPDSPGGMAETRFQDAPGSIQWPTSG